VRVLIRTAVDTAVGWRADPSAQVAVNGENRDELSSRQRARCNVLDASPALSPNDAVERW